MTSRDRTQLALAHRAADRLPIDLWISPGLSRRLEHDLGLRHAELLDRYGVDLRYLAGPRYVGPDLAPDRDVWGVRRIAVDVPVRHGVEHYSEVCESPLAEATTVADIHGYRGWPSPDWFDYRTIEAQCDGILAEQRVVVFMGDRLNRVAQLKPAMYLRGVEAMFEDVALREEMAMAVIDRVREFYLGYLERILAAARGKIDIVLTGDDFGSQNGLLLAPAAWRRLVRPGFAAYTRLIKEAGAKAMHHTCGAVTEIIPDLIECGLDVLQSVQPEAAGMDLAELQRGFGRDLCFHGGISIQRTMPYGTPTQVRAEVRTIADLFRGRGGYVFCSAHNLQADTPTANVLALLDAYHEFG